MNSLLDQKVIDRFTAVYGSPPQVAARAPGRVEFIGNHTDYNGGPVMGAAIDRGVWIALAPRTDGKRRFFSEGAGEKVELNGRELVKQKGAAAWVNYPLGVLAALEAFGLRAPEGFDFLAISDLPVGAGLSSSAALELSSALAFLELSGAKVSREQLVKIGHHAENKFVGVPCGILDQGVSAFGKKDHLVRIDCRGPVFSTVPLPSGVYIWIFNTHTRHSLIDGLYTARRNECEAAAASLGVAYLADITSAQLETGRTKLSDLLYRRARHVVAETERVDRTSDALARGEVAIVGTLLTESHRSSQLFFENSTPELDFLVDTLVAKPEVYGARLTGGGFGGAVMAMTRPGFDESRATEVLEAYGKRFGAATEGMRCQADDGATVLSVNAGR